MNRSSIQRFDVDLTRFAKRIDVNLGRVVKRTAFRLFDKIVRRTPVDTGRARASWDMSVGSPGGHVQLEIPRDRKLSPSQATSTAMSHRLSDYGIERLEPIYIYNNVEYIGKLEYGHSRQAPHGMVQVSLAEVETEMNQILSGIGK